MDAARAAQSAWVAAPLQERIERLRAFAARLELEKDALAELISRETGKPGWESLAEVTAMAGKVPLSIEAYERRRAPESIEIGGAAGAVRYKPHGVVAVFGPFNLPGHLPNGHIVPALLAGNTVVFKPSERAAGVAERTIRCWQESGLPSGVLNLVQGARDTGALLAGHANLDGLFFTGGCGAGLALRRALADQPQKILALEMGGNNPLIVYEAEDLDAAAYETVQSAYLTAGQRCTCARRLIVPIGRAGDAFIERLVRMIGRVRIGGYTDRPEPFMGPLIDDDAAGRLIAAQRAMLGRGGVALVTAGPLPRGGSFVSPGLIDMTAVADRPDEEIFGPLLQLVRTDGFDAAIAEANRTAYGLSAGLFSDRRDLFERFYARTRAGVIAWNRQITNASGRLPFGGVGLSGNHRPSGYFAADYCSYPVASLEVARLAMPARLTPGLSP